MLIALVSGMSKADEFGPNLHALPDWGAVEKRLVNEWGEGKLGIDAFMKSALFRDLLGSDNELLWNAMIAEADHPVVVLAGFLCISQKRSERVMSAGLRVIAESKQPVSPIYGPIYEVLGERKAAKKRVDPSELDSTLRQGGASIGSLFCAISLVPTSTIAGWLRSKEAKQAPAQSVAVALEVVLEEGRDNWLTAEEADKLLEKLAQCPGFPRLVYVSHARARDSGFFEALHAVLADMQLEDLAIATLVIRRKVDIKDRADALLIGIPEKRSQLVRKALTR